FSLDGRQAQREHGAAARRVRRLGHAAVRFDDVPHDREAEAGPGRSARRRRTVEALEHERQVGFVDPGAVVAYDDGAAGNANVDGAARRAPLQGVAEDVRYRAGEPLGVAAHGTRLRVELEADTARVSAHALDLDAR